MSTFLLVDDLSNNLILKYLCIVSDYEIFVLFAKKKLCIHGKNLCHV